MHVLPFAASSDHDTVLAGHVLELTPMGAVVAVVAGSADHALCDHWRVYSMQPAPLPSSFAGWFDDLLSGASPGLVAELFYAAGHFAAFAALVQVSPEARQYILALPVYLRNRADAPAALTAADMVHALLVRTAACEAAIDALDLQQGHAA
ncbi:hypothetical protein [Caldimonas tepidiphila]|uniref:hypothetical protein n=1 Tax=Caldimonas tepidiphila TaxID=2315841 RepID=UPI0013006FAE|nr:hypothetical protein [Caldimonas tepidiphila]